ncbi:MAG: AAA family ATPase [Gemmatimonadaceae bacterium]
MTLPQESKNPEPNNDVRVRVQTFGACTVDIANNRLGRNADIVIALVLLLIHAPGMQMPRDQLIGTLWPDSPEARRRGNLRQALYKLRQMGVRASMNGDQVQLDESQIEKNFSMDRTQARFEADIVRARDPFGPFLPGFLTIPGSLLDHWFEAQRERAHADARRVLASALRVQHSIANWQGAEPLARWLLQFDPLNEAATLVIAECLVLSGAKYEAIRLLDRYMNELGPGAEDLRIPASTLRRRIATPSPRRISFAPTERHFIGRESIMAQTTLALRRARFKDGTATLLHGTAGIGKTRLMNEVTKISVIEGLNEVRTGCRQTDLTRPLSVFLDVVPELLQMKGALGCSPESLQALKRFVNDEDWIAERNAANGAPVAMPLAAALRRAIVDVVVAISDEKPLFIIIEDVHWLDAISWEVIVDLVDRTANARVCLLMTSRLPHARPQPPERMPVSLNVQALEPLSMENCLRLARAIGTDLSASIDDELGEWFASTSEGVPLFLRSLVNHWIETGEAGGVPPTLVGAISQRLQSLSVDALRVLQTIALLGRHAELSMIELVLELPYYRVVSALDDLQKASAFDASANGALVCHELIGRMAVGGLGLNAKRSLHKRIAQILIGIKSDVLSPALCRDRLEHLLLSGEIRTFLKASCETVRELLVAGYSYDALGVAEGALEHASEPEDRDGILALQAESLYGCGEYARLLSHPLSPSSVGLGLSQWESQEPESLVRWLDAAAHADRGANASDLAAAATLVSETERYSNSVRYNAATLAIRIAANACEYSLAHRAYVAGKIALVSLTRPEERVDELDMLFHTSFGDYKVALAAAKRMLRVAETLRSTTERLSLQLRIAFAFRCCGDIEEARKLFEKVHFDSKKDRLESTYSFASWRLSSLHLDDGDLPQAEHWLREYFRVAPVDREPLAGVLLHTQTLRIALELGDVNRAESHLRLAHASMQEEGHVVRHAHSLAAQLGIARRRGDLSELARTMELAYPVYERARRATGQSFFACELTLSLHALGLHLEASTLAYDYIHVFRKEPSPIPKYFSAGLRAIGITLDIRPQLTIDQSTELST